MEDIERTPASRWEKFGYGSLGLLPLSGSAVISVVEAAGFARLPSLVITLGLLAAAALHLCRRVTAEREKRLAADLEKDVFDCAIRFPDARPGSLLERWNGGSARIQDHGLAFQPLTGPDVLTPAAGTRVISGVKYRGPAGSPPKRPREWRRNWTVAECDSDAGLLQVAAPEAALDKLPRPGSG